MNATTLELDKVSVNSALVVQEMGMETSTTNITFDFDVQTNAPTVSVDVQTNESDKYINFIDNWNSEIWTSEKGQRFRELALKESLGELTIEELAELEVLTRLRRTVKNPRKADEILWERRQNRVTKELMCALQNYVEFHESSHQA